MTMSPGQLSSILWLDKLSKAAQAVVGLVTLFWVVSLVRGAIMADHDSLIVGGLLSGGLHAMTGPDHLAALLPFIFRKKWYVSFTIGLTWGIGHSLSTSFMGASMYFLKDSLLQTILLDFVAKFADLLVGISLIIIGLLGLQELKSAIATPNTDPGISMHLSSNKPTSSSIYTPTDREFKTLSDSEALNEDIEPHSGSIFIDARISAMNRNTPCGGFLILSAIFSNGFLLGLSWDSLPSLGPSIGASSWDDLAWFLSAYSLSTALVMALMTSSISVCALLVSKYSEDSESLPLRLSAMSCYTSLFLGVVWITHGMMHYLYAIDDELPSMSWYIWAISIISPISIVLVILFTVIAHFGLWDSLFFGSFQTMKAKSDDVPTPSSQI